MNISIQKKEIPLKVPFVYYLDTLTSLPYAEVIITTDDGVSGVGEIPCALDINGETAEGSVALASFIEHVLFGFSIHSEDDVARAMETLSLHLAFNTATLFGVEQALFDILAKRKGVSVAYLFGPKKEKVKTQIAIPYLESEEEYKRRVDEIFQKDPSYVKIKIGGNMKWEANAIKMIRTYSKEVILGADANQAFKHPDDALRFLKEVEGCSLTLLEQPFSRHAPIEFWKKLKKETQVSLMADESIHTYNDAQFFIQNKAVDYINLKLAKCGGVFEARRIIALAKKHNISVMLGSMLEGEVALKYNLAFALSQDFVAHDFSTHYLETKNALFGSLIDKKILFTTEEVLA